MTKSQKYKKEYAKELLKIAEGDFETTKVLYNAKAGRKENICFIAQQVVEKSIKAVLCHLELPIPHTHNLDILMDKLPDKYQTLEADGYNELTEYETIRRYENGNFELDSDDLRQAFAVAEKFLLWAKSIVEDFR